MLELHYPTVTKTILERQYPGKPTLKVAFGNGNGAIFENSSKLRGSLVVMVKPNSQVHHLLTWDQALFSFRFENYIPAGKAKRKDSR